jgi:AraC family transcriptional regulator, melibiose operon regulatory protein
MSFAPQNPERLDVVKMELNALFRRVSLGPFPFLKKPWRDKPTEVGLPTPHVRHVVDMVRHVLENIATPLQNKDVTKITGLHTNYALSLFSNTMQLPLKQFIIRFSQPVLCSIQIRLRNIATELAEQLLESQSQLKLDLGWHFDAGAFFMPCPMRSNLPILQPD